MEHFVTHYTLSGGHGFPDVILQDYYPEGDAGWVELCDRAGCDPEQAVIEVMSAPWGDHPAGSAIVYVPGEGTFAVIDGVG